MDINSEKEAQKIIKFIKKTLDHTGKNKVIIGLSGGIDSITSLFLLKQAINPLNIFVLHLPYLEPSFTEFEEIAQHAEIPKKNTQRISIKNAVDALQHALKIKGNRVRLGNIMARVRMTMLYDLAKKNNALVCGTENKSEFHLGYFTRFGDEASDFEPIRHLYKTQVYELALYLGISKKIIKQKPTAGLWQGQTDEGQFGFSYQEADWVMYLFFDKQESINEIEQKGFKNAQKIIDFCQKHAFKHRTPYTI